MNKDFKISFDWEVKTAENTERVGAPNWVVFHGLRPWNTICK